MVDFNLKAQPIDIKISVIKINGLKENFPLAIFRGRKVKVKLLINSVTILADAK